MSKTNFTSGSWKVEFSTCEDMIFTYIKKEKNKTIAEVFLNNYDEDEQEANAHLIAAAPEMYEACRFHCETHCKMRNLNKKVCKNCLFGKALRKARGESEADN